MLSVAFRRSATDVAAAAWRGRPNDRSRRDRTLLFVGTAVCCISEQVPQRRSDGNRPSTVRESRLAPASVGPGLVLRISVADNRLTIRGNTAKLLGAVVRAPPCQRSGSALTYSGIAELAVGLKVDAEVVLSAAKKAVYNSWGPGKYDPRFNFDGKNGPQVIPPAYGLAGINKIISTGDGDDLAYWNRYVGVTQMGGHGSFVEPRTGHQRHRRPDHRQAAGPADVPALPGGTAATTGSFDAVAAARGKLVFEGAGKCATCHTGGKLTDANARLHPPGEVVSEPEPKGAPSYASRSATKQYRTAPLRGLWQHAPYFHNGTAPTVEAAIQTYNTNRALGLTATQVSDMAQYLKSL